MVRYTHYDITNASYEEFIAFLFDHVPVPKGSAGPPFWYWGAHVTFDPQRVASLYIRLFTEPAALLEQYTRPQLEQGFCAIQSRNLECSIAGVIWDHAIPVEIRERCLRSMFHLFERLFAHDPLDTAVQMWWDSLAYDWHCHNRSRENGGEDRRMQDVMFETLSKILGLSSAIAQAAALHGLGHLHHPDTETLIAGYLASNPTIDSSMREYALMAARFEML